MQSSRALRSERQLPLGKGKLSREFILRDNWEGQTFPLESSEELYFRFEVYAELFFDG